MGQGAVFTVPQKEENPSEKDLGSMRKCKRSSENEYLTGNRLGESGNRTLPLRNDGDGALQRCWPFSYECNFFAKFFYLFARVKNMYIYFICRHLLRFLLSFCQIF